MQIEMPANVEKIIHVLEASGWEAYAVGGCVRDALLGRVPQDWDITTSARPKDVKELFPRTVDTGIAHGTVTVVMDKIGYEVTTYRIDGLYEDGRHPVSVEFSRCLSEDLKRRDFTVNAMAYNPQRGLVDQFQGRQDLQQGLIRCVGCAADRFQEDALRMMRAIRFSAQLGFEIEDETWKAITALAPSIEKVSRERICAELEKMLLSERPDIVEKLEKSGIAEAVLPPLHKVLTSMNAVLALETVRIAEPVLVLRLAALMNLAGKDETQALLKGLKLDNYTLHTTVMLVENAKFAIEENEYQVRKALNRFGKDNLQLILKNQQNLLLAKERVMGIGFQSAKKHLKMLFLMMQGILERQECFTLEGLAIGGKELLQRGFEGPDIGRQLALLLDMVMENPKLNTTKSLLAAIENHFI